MSIIWCACAVLTLAFLALNGIESFEIQLIKGRASCGQRGAVAAAAWFGGGGGGDQQANNNEANTDHSTSDGGAFESIGKSLSGISGTMMAMENFKASQRIGKTTEALVQDLSTISIEGSSSNGKVKVTLDGRQQPIGASMEEAFFKEASASSVTTAFVEAMQDAHAKSKDTMNDKMKGFYNELGL